VGLSCMMLLLVMVLGSKDTRGICEVCFKCPGSGQGGCRHTEINGPVTGVWGAMRSGVRPRDSGAGPALSRAVLGVTGLRRGRRPVATACCVLRSVSRVTMAGNRKHGDGFGGCDWGILQCESLIIHDRRDINTLEMCSSLGLAGGGCEAQQRRCRICWCADREMTVENNEATCQGSRRWIGRGPTVGCRWHVACGQVAGGQVGGARGWAEHACIVRRRLVQRCQALVRRGLAPLGLAYVWALLWDR
jgi:hypothetical protein